MPDDTKDIYPDETVDPMQGAKENIGLFAICKACMSILSSMDMAFFSKFFFQRENNDSSENSDDKIEWSNVEPLLYTLVDFAFSMAVGYGIYAPMDTSNKEIKDSDYGKLIEAASKACGEYTKIWFTKTAVALFIPTVYLLTLNETIKPLLADKDTIKKIFKKLNYLNDIFNGILAIISMAFEIKACVIAGKVKGCELTDDQKKDKDYFLFETVGFIFGDARTVVDSVISFFKLENPSFCAAREILAFVYLITLFMEIGLVC